MPEQQNEPLISSQTSVNMGPTESDSNKRAFKVAGLTVLACVLIAGQGLTAYFLLNQKSQISALEDSANSLKKEMIHQQSGSSAGRVMNVPMSSMSMMIHEDPKPEDASVQKPCLMQAAEAGPGDFRPQCDVQGNFQPMQCQQKTSFCWCVDSNGKMIGVPTPGKANCGGTPRAMGHMAAMPSMLEKTDE